MCVTGDVLQSPSTNVYQWVFSTLFQNDSHSWRLKIAYKSPSLAHNLSLLSLYPLSASVSLSLLSSLHLSLAIPSLCIFHANAPNW